MFDGLHPITAEDFVPFLKDMPHSLVISIYCISRYHEKFRVTKWCMAEFDEQFEGFYDQMLKQNDL